MFKKAITYTDYEGNERKEDFYFNLTKAELMEMDLSENGGMDNKIKRIINTRNTKEIIEIFKDIILRSYGEKSPDGKMFIKVRNGHALSEDFAQTEAYSELFMELATDDKAATEFISGVIPKQLSDELAAQA